MNNDEEDEGLDLFDAYDSISGVSLWILIPKAGFWIGFSVVMILILFWMEFGELSTFAYIFAGALGLFQILMIYGLRQYKKAIPIIADTPLEEPKRESRDK